MSSADLFPVGVPAAEGQVVDREAFIDQLAARLQDRSSVVLAGPRRVGKTSVALEVLRRLREAGAYTATVDLGAISSVRELAEKLTLACLANLTPPLRAARRAGQGLADAVRMPELRAKMHEFELTVALRGGDGARTPEALLDEALDLPERMAAKGDRRFVLLFDEFQGVAGLGQTGILARMRSAFQQQRHTGCLFLGSHAGLMAQLFGVRSQPFFRFATLLQLPPVPEHAWRTYIRERLATRAVGIDDAAVDALLDYTGGHPYDTMKVAYEAYLLRGARHTLDASIVLTACAAAQEQLAAVFDAEIDGAGPRARAVLGRIAKQENLYADETSKGSVALAIKHLVTAGMLRRTGRGRYAFAEPMLARHLA